MSLPQADLEYLRSRGTPYEIVNEAGMTCVVMRGFPLPLGYDHQHADLLLRLSPGYPDVPPDMWWFNPPVRLANGGAIQATQSTENHLGISWQRWSRHFAPGQWLSGIDCLETFMALIKRELERCAPLVSR